MQMLPGFRDRLQARRNVHPITVYLIVLNDDVPKVHADPRFDVLFGRPGRIDRRLRILDRLRTADRVDHAIEFAKDGVPRRIDHPPFMRLHHGLDA